jgi:hypothetical protein
MMIIIGTWYMTPLHIDDDDNLIDDPLFVE